MAGHALAGILALIGLLLGLLAMKNPAGKGAWMTGVILSALTLLLALASILLNVLGFAVIAAQPTQPVQNWNQPQPGPVPARR